MNDVKPLFSLYQAIRHFKGLVKNDLLMNKISTVFLFFAYLFAILFCSSCKKEKQVEVTGQTLSTRADIQFHKFYNEEGTMEVRLWKNGDTVAIFNTESESSSAFTASPVYTGEHVSSFNFEFKDIEGGDALVGFFPYTADLTCSKGKLTTEIPEIQNGRIIPAYIGKTIYYQSFSGIRMDLSPCWSTVYADVQKGSYSIKKAVLATNNGEKISGKVTVNVKDMSVTASSDRVTVEFEKPVDCRSGGIRFPFTVAPCSLSKGYTITYTTETGETFEYKTNSKFRFDMGEIYDQTSSIESFMQVLVCGDNMIYLLDADLAVTSGYRNAIMWEWNAKDWYQTVGLAQNKMIRLDECKPVDDNRKILATSSRGYAVLIDMKSGDVLWYSNKSTQAHSCEMLPNNRIAIACSGGGDCIQIFDAEKSNSVLFSTPLDSAHGVVWNPATERLYAVGGKTFNIYKLTDWDTSSPKLTLDKSITTTKVSSLHDLTLVDENTLLLAGNKAVLYNISKNTFTNIPIFNSSRALKAVNYNGETGECWFTDPTEVEVPDLTWASRTIRYTDNAQKTYQTRSFKIDDLNVYKVRVFNW